MTANVTPVRKSRLLLKLGFALGVVLLSLGVVEGALRVAGFSYHLYPERIRFGYPEPEKIEEGYFLPHDRFLWVSRKYDEILAGAQAETPDVILMGCSCTEWGEYDLALGNQATQAGSPLKISNFGCAGWSTYQGLNQLQDDVLPIGPKIVTIYFGWNDHWIGHGIEDKAVAELTASPWKRTMQESRLVQWASKVMVSRRAVAQRTLGEGAFPERVSLEDFRSNLTAMIQLARDNDIIPVLITAPDGHEEGKEPRYLEGAWLQELSDLIPLHQSYVSAVRQVAEEQGVVLCDLAAQFDALPPKTTDLYIKADGIHLTPDIGGRVVGRMLYQTLAEHGLL